MEKGDRGGVYGGTSGCDDLESASQTIYNKTGKYGYMAYSHDQISYWNFVYQNGGQILRDDGSEAMYYAGNWDLANLCATYPDMLQMQAI
ncbi:hypothetical protein H6B11_07790 [Mediterraneibacter glycyrrhizinilyticus]|nr:hypothetical protein [Mediterraneibacter glycyrrhizinilyticus]MBM6854060.1 hypothetical protein [Mediterraneibacter glycyrrhizinilyticus]